MFFGRLLGGEPTDSIVTREHFARQIFLLESRKSEVVVPIGALLRVGMRTGTLKEGFRLDLGGGHFYHLRRHDRVVVVALPG